MYKLVCIKKTIMYSQLYMENLKVTYYPHCHTDACMCTSTEFVDLPNYVRTCQRAGIDACKCNEVECQVEAI